MEITGLKQQFRQDFMRKLAKRAENERFGQEKGKKMAKINSQHQEQYRINIPISCPKEYKDTKTYFL